MGKTTIKPGNVIKGGMPSTTGINYDVEINFELLKAGLGIGP